MQQFVLKFLTFLFLFCCTSTLSANVIRLDLICQAKCLQNFKLKASTLDDESITKNPFLIESFCFKDSSCKGCMTACSTHEKSVDICQSNCKVFMEELSRHSCTQSCKFIESKKINRPGICPSTMSHKKCPYSCIKDVDCFKQGTKCCATLLCGSTCQIAHLPNKNVPPAPSAPNVRQTIDQKDKDQIKFDLDWSTYDISSVDYPVLFLVQVRVGQLVQNNTKVQGIWQDLISTTKSGVIISAIDPENWYQFRLIAFSKNGYKNHGEMTTPITVQYKPTYPMSPVNLTEKVSRIIDKHFSVTVTWQPGESNSLLPLSNYKINWRRFHEMYESSPILPEYEIIIPASETSYTIQDLQPSTTYRIQITSVIIYKGTKYNSTGAVYYVTTSPIPNSNHNEVLPANINYNNECGCGSSYKLLPIEIRNYSMINDKLIMLVKFKDGIEFDNTFAPYSLRVQWYPTVCIDPNSWKVSSQISDLPQSIILNNYNNHYISGLRMQCTYKIEVELFSKLAMKNIRIWDGCFCTPNCDTLAKHNKAIICPQTEQRIPASPKNLRISLQKSENESTSDAELQWDIISSHQVTGFRITWGPRLEEPLDVPVYSNDLLPLLDSSRAMSKVIKFPRQILLLKNLEINKIYLVKLQSMNNHLSSQESVFFFKVYFDKNISNVYNFHKTLLLIPLSLALILSL